MSASETGAVEGFAALGLGWLEAGAADDGEPTAGVAVGVAVGGVEAAGVDVQPATIATIDANARIAGAAPGA
jgi:hypothetical protein